jgi:hypothetical protein
MSTSAQRAATAAHRKRAKAKGLVRIEVQVPKRDAALVRKLARSLRGPEARASSLRQSLGSSLADSDEGSVLSMFASDLPDEYFEGVFDRVRDISKRKIDL